MSNKKIITQEILNKAFGIVNEKTKRGSANYVVTSSTYADAIVKLMTIQQRKDKLKKIIRKINYDNK